SRYITLEAIAEGIRQGDEVRVIDAKSGDDITKTTLTQIIIEGRHADRFLPVDVLHQLIRLGDDALAGFCGRYLTGAMEIFLQSRKAAQAIGGFNPFGPFNPFAAV